MGACDEDTKCKDDQPWAGKLVTDAWLMLVGERIPPPVNWNVTSSSLACVVEWVKWCEEVLGDV